MTEQAEKIFASGYMRLDAFVCGGIFMYQRCGKFVTADKGVLDAREGEAFGCACVDDEGLVWGIVWAPISSLGPDISLRMSDGRFLRNGGLVDELHVYPDFAHAREVALNYLPVYAQTIPFTSMKAAVLGHRTKIDRDGEKRLLSWFREHEIEPLNENIRKHFHALPWTPCAEDIAYIKTGEKAKP